MFRENELSASGLSLFFDCKGPFQTGVLWFEDENDDKSARDIGNLVSQLAALRINQLQSASEAMCNVLLENTVSDDVAESFRHIAATWGEGLEIPHGAESEVAYALNRETGKTVRLGVDIKRDYSACSEFVKGRDIPGTDDMEWIEGTTLHVLDFKSGNPANVPSVNNNPQLQFLALCAADYHRSKGRTIENVRVWLEFIDKRTGTSRREHHDMSLEALESMRAKLMVPQSEVDTAEPTPGPHCASKYCKAAHQCSKLRAGLAKIDTNILSIPERIEMMTHEETGQALAKWEVLSKAYKQIDKTLRKHAKHLACISPVPMPNGNEFRRTTRNEDVWHPLTAKHWDALYAILGEDAFIAMDPSKAALQRACANQRDPDAAFVRAMDTLRNLGAVTSREQVVFKEVRSSAVDNTERED